MTAIATPPALALRAVSQRFALESGILEVLHDISLTITAGEMVAIMGPSGSGKSTLMNILGCLDTPSDGEYAVDGIAVHTLPADARAQLRREKFGFVFQRYQLIPTLSVIENIEMPARYGNDSRLVRREKARHLLTELGLSGFEHRHVTQLSGGQQQRVSLARALINGGTIILADEPTGALDRQSSQAVMLLLQRLHRQGHTVIVITHDPDVARYAERKIQLRDGRIIADRRQTSLHKKLPASAPRPVLAKHERRPLEGWLDVLVGAWRTLKAHRLRSSLTLLGIVIGIVSVVTLNAAGEGARRYVMKTLSSLGGNVITLSAGRGLGDDLAAQSRALRERDLAMLSAQPWITSLSPQVTLALRIRWQRVDTNANVHGVSADYLKTASLSLVRGRSLLPYDIDQHAAVVVIDENLMNKLFPAHQDPLGTILLLGNLPCRVVGVVRNGAALPAPVFNLWLPWSTANSRLLGQDWFNTITITLPDAMPTAAAREALHHRLLQLHGREDFSLQDNAAFIHSIEKTSLALRLFLWLIALVSLLVGGIGVMNIMLVSVTERTRETGIRMAVGARQRDIQSQFLAEAILLCLVGAAVGIGLSLALGGLFAFLMPDWQLVYSVRAMLMATGCALVVGILSGWLPARKAARRDPAEALTRE
ncbi:ABC transporter permease [Rouxiella chamberiensis]|uniref:ATP-binding cassette domain-containing protein n=1 Tax=Rouxiella chamberiensis TaxID=1513468 RepID=A0ABY7HT12_9GAMM|nr:ABC transporter permease [Rouxiella chamberiensis]WAT02147.1 ATP-binding cassette domain-containing protein [Rouxiella chamberiensis]